MSGGLPPLVIVGPTAAGKSSLAMALAARMAGAEIISMDAMAVYRGMDIGTAKPTKAEQALVRHHLIDVVDPSDNYDLSRFSEKVSGTLADLAQRGAPAILVGGTGLYVRAVIDSFELPGQFPTIRAALEAEPDTDLLWQRLHEADSAASAKMERSNRRRIIRALEVCLGSGRPFSSFGPGVDAYPPSGFLQIGLEIDRELLDQRIADRYDAQLAAGFADEVAGLLASEGLGRTASQALGYRELAAHLAGEITLEEAMEEARRRTRRFARRQQRWFRRDPRVIWLDSQSESLVDQAAARWESEADSQKF